MKQTCENVIGLLEKKKQSKMFQEYENSRKQLGQDFLYRAKVKSIGSQLTRIKFLMETFNWEFA